MALVAGVIDTTSNYVEHPRWWPTGSSASSRRSATRTRVIAGTDCGFDTSAGIGDVAPSLVWEKLRALRDGADLASERLPADSFGGHPTASRTASATPSRSSRGSSKRRTTR